MYYLWTFLILVTFVFLLAGIIVVVFARHATRWVMRCKLGQLTRERIAKVVKTLDYSRHDEEYAAFRFEAEGFTEEEARELAGKWNRRELEEEPARKPTPAVDRRSGTVRVFEQLITWYPSEIIDVVADVTKSTNLETLRKYCRRYAGELFESAPDELKQKVKEGFLI